MHPLELEIFSEIAPVLSKFRYSFRVFETTHGLFFSGFAFVSVGRHKNLQSK